MRHKDSRAGRLKLAAERCCRVCEETSWLSRHHLVPRSLGGDDVDDNIVPLCETCHGDFERSGKHRRHVGHLIRGKLTAGERAYVIEKKGEDFLERYYPKE